MVRDRSYEQVRRENAELTAKLARAVKISQQRLQQRNDLRRALQAAEDRIEVLEARHGR